METGVGLAAPICPAKSPHRWMCRCHQGTHGSRRPVVLSPDQASLAECSWPVIRCSLLRAYPIPARGATCTSPLPSDAGGLASADFLHALPRTLAGPTRPHTGRPRRAPWGEKAH